MLGVDALDPLADSARSFAVFLAGVPAGVAGVDSLPDPPSSVVFAEWLSVGAVGAAPSHPAVESLLRSSGLVALPLLWPFPWQSLERKPDAVLAAFA